MILTGKAKEDFEKYVSYKYGEGDKELKMMRGMYLNALIIDFFDSVGFIITILEESFNNVDIDFDFWTPEFMYQIKTYIELDNRLNYYIQNDSIDNFKHRKIATEQAIIKANEIYNTFKL